MKDTIHEKKKERFLFKIIELHTTIICLIVRATLEGSIRYRSCIPNSTNKLLGCDLY